MPAPIRLLMNDDYKLTAQELLRNGGYQIYFVESRASCDRLYHLIGMHAINGVFINKETAMNRLPLFEVLTLRAIGTLFPAADNVDCAMAHAHAVRVFAPSPTNANPPAELVMSNVIAYLNSEECFVRRETLYPKKGRSFFGKGRFDMSMVYVAHHAS